MHFQKLNSSFNRATSALQSCSKPKVRALISSLQFVAAVRKANGLQFDMSRFHFAKITDSL